MSKTRPRNPSQIAQQLKRQREMEKERSRIFGLITGSDGHDRATCNCEGCKWFWLTVTGVQDGRFYKRFVNIKSCIREQGIRSHLRSYMVELRKRAMCDERPIWMAFPHNKQMMFIWM